MHPSYLAEEIKILSGLDYLTHKEILKTIDAFFRLLRREVARGNRVTFTRLGSFSTRTLPPRSGVSPQGKAWSLPARKVIRFRPGTRFLDEVRAAGLSAGENQGTGGEPHGV